MATDNESFNRDLYDLLKVRGYNPVPLNAQNQRVKASQEADVIQFEFNKDGESYGTAWVTVDDAQNIIVYYDQEQQDSPSTNTPGVDYDDSWTGFLKHLKNWAQRRQMSFELANKDRLGDDMRQREYYKMKEKLGESYHPMGKKASYNDAVPNVKIVLQHNRSLEEGEARYRNVARIYLENVDGERFLAPTTRPGIARVYARHIAEGGLPNDDKWNHIKSICEDYNKMAGFVRATKNGQFNESAQELVQEGVNHYHNLRETLHKLTTHKGYHNYFESYTPALMEGDGEDLSEMFMSSSLDPRIESAMPILSRLKKPVTEMSEVDTLAEWADSIISEKLELDENQFTVSAPPKYPPTEIDAASRDEAVELAAKRWRIPAEEITVHGGGKSGAGTSQSSSEPTPTGGTALSRAEKKAKDMKNPLDNFSTDDLWNIGKLAVGLGEGDVIKFPKGWVDASDEGEDEMDWDDESWIPSEEEFEREEELRNRKRHHDNDLEEMDKMSGSRRDFDGPRGPDKTAKPVKAKDFAKKALKSLKRGMKGWEKGIHDVDTVKTATKSLSPDQKEKALAAKVGKGSPAELQQKLIKREKNKKTDENFIGMAPQAVAEEEVEEARVGKVNVEVTDKGAVYINGTRITGRGTKWGVQNTVFSAKVPKDQVVQTLRDNGFGNIKLDPQYSAEMGITLEEDLGPEQKRVGQLGPTEKVKNNNIGKLVGASESKEMDPELARIIEMARFKR